MKPAEKVVGEQHPSKSTDPKRILGRKLARELSAAECEAIAGAAISYCGGGHPCDTTTN